MGAIDVAEEVVAKKNIVECHVLGTVVGLGKLDWYLDH